MCRHVATHKSWKSCYIAGNENPLLGLHPKNKRNFKIHKANRRNTASQNSSHCERQPKQLDWDPGDPCSTPVPTTSHLLGTLKQLKFSTAPFFWLNLHPFPQYRQFFSVSTALYRMGSYSHLLPGATIAPTIRKQQQFLFTLGKKKKLKKAKVITPH